MMKRCAWNSDMAQIRYKSTTILADLLRNLYFCRAFLINLRICYV